MHTEVERKYVINPTKEFKDLLKEWKKDPVIPKIRIVQGYLHTDTPPVRVRLQEHTMSGNSWFGEDDQVYDAYLNIKMALSGLRRKEYETRISVDDAKQFLKACPWKITKVRYIYKVGELTWEIDIFSGLNRGLLIAEVEFPWRAKFRFSKPSWVAREVTEDKRFANVELSLRPISKWNAKERTMLTVF